MPLSGALQRVAKEQVAVVYRDISVNLPEGAQRVQLTVKPLSLRDENASLMLVLIEALGAPAPQTDDRPEESVSLGEVSRDQFRSLEVELQYTKENLQATLEEMETSNEELQATNEELVASNEELQSTNEELHSVNEELYTVNAEYQKKISELTQLTSDMDNLLQSTDIGTIFLDRELCIRKFTPRIAQTFNLLPYDIGRRIDTFSHNIQHFPLTEHVTRVLKSSTPFETEVQDRHGGQFLLRILPYRSKIEVDGVVLTLIDISVLNQTKQHLQALIDHADAAIFLKDLQGHYLQVNRYFASLLGTTADEVRGRTDHDLMPPELADKLHRDDQQVAASGEALTTEDLLPSDQGNRSFLSVKFPLTDGNARVYAVAGISTDVTERKRIHEERQRNAAELEATNEVLRENIAKRNKAETEAREAVKRRDQFLAMLSHELRNPLGAVLNATNLLAHDDVDHETARLAYEVIQRQAQQMARLLDDLLDVSRVIQGKIEMRCEVLDLRDIVRDVVQALGPVFEARQQKLSVTVPDEWLFVRADPARLLQIQENLLANAAKYTPPGGQVWFKVEREGDDVVIQVRDTGAGIPPAMIERIFDPFVQSNETLDRSDGGMGVGLTLVKHLVEMHDGSITAQSDGPGQGSLFVVRLPLAREEDAPPRRDARPGQPPNARRVLIVEDNADSRDMLKSLLQLEGCQVSVAEDGRRGLEAILSQRPDVALVDIGLPGMDGYQVARQVRQTLGKNEVYLVALTGYGRTEDRRAVLEAGFDEHLVKPLKLDELDRILSRSAESAARSESATGIKSS